MTADARPACGEQLELRHGRHRAIVVEVGGGLRAYDVGGEPVLDGYAASEICPGAAGQPLVPWPNRLGDGRYTHGGATHQLAVTEPATGCAIHGLGRWSAWRLRRLGEGSGEASLRLPPQPGYPYDVDVVIVYALKGAGLEVTATARNRGAAAAPWGIGFHPYLHAGTGGVDELRLVTPARSRLRLDDRGLPTGQVVSASGWLFGGEAIGDRRLDDCLCGFEGGGETGLLRAVVSGRGGHDLAVWADPSLPYLMLFSGDTLAPGRRRRGLAVEPMSCPPDAFRSGAGLVVLAPGAAAVHRWGITVTDAA